MGGSRYPVRLSSVYADCPALYLADSWNVKEEENNGMLGNYSL